MPGYDTALWTGLFAPAKTPQAIVSRLHGELKSVLSDAEVRAALAKQGAEPALTEPAELAAFVSAELERWAKVVKEQNIKVE